MKKLKVRKDIDWKKLFNIFKRGIPEDMFVEIITGLPIYTRNKLLEIVKTENGIVKVPSEWTYKSFLSYLLYELNPRKNKSNPRFDAPLKKPKEKWYALLTYNGTIPLTRVVISFPRKSQANNYAKELIGKLYKARLVTSVVLEGPFKTMTEANQVEISLTEP